MSLNHIAYVLGGCIPYYLAFMFVVFLLKKIFAKRYIGININIPLHGFFLTILGLLPVLLGIINFDTLNHGLLAGIILLILVYFL